MNSMGRVGTLRKSFCWVMMEIGSDLDGSDLMMFLMLRSGFRFFSRSTTWSRPRSLTHGIVAAVASTKGMQLVLLA